MIIITTICLVCYLTTVQAYRLTAVFRKSDAIHYFHYNNRNTIYFNSGNLAGQHAPNNCQLRYWKSVYGKLSGTLLRSVDQNLCIVALSYLKTYLIYLDNEDEDFLYDTSSYSNSANITVRRSLLDYS